MAFVATDMRANVPIGLAKHSLLALATTLTATLASANPITATVEGCVKADDPRLAAAVWSADGTFQAVAFDDRLAGCETTIQIPLHDTFVFDEDRVMNTLTARLNLQNLPECGRRQYDLHYYLDDGLLDALGLRSLVIDTGVDCPVICVVDCDDIPRVPEPHAVVLLMLGVAWAIRHRGHG